MTWVTTARHTVKQMHATRVGCLFKLILTRLTLAPQQQIKEGGASLAPSSSPQQAMIAAVKDWERG